MPMSVISMQITDLNMHEVVCAVCVVGHYEQLSNVIDVDANSVHMQPLPVLQETNSGIGAGV